VRRIAIRQPRIPQDEIEGHAAPQDKKWTGLICPHPTFPRTQGKGINKIQTDLALSQF
jgi:hypothetical protein